MKAIFDNYPEDTLQATRSVKTYRKFRLFWFAMTTILVYVWARAYFYDKSHQNNCFVEVTETGEVKMLHPSDFNSQN